MRDGALADTSEPDWFYEYLVMRLDGKKSSNYRKVVRESAKPSQCALQKKGTDVAVNYRTHPELRSKRWKIFGNWAAKRWQFKETSAGYLTRNNWCRISRLPVNNAGVEKGASFWEVTEADHDFVLGVNLKGAFFTT
jgi:hypothetical protein